jgi:hypothetical protein
LIQVELSAAEIPIEPGGTAQLTVTVTNKQPHDDHLFLEIEGIDVEWYALPVPALNIAAGASQSARVLFKIARSSESRAGTYPFLVRARGMESGAAGVQQATLVIKPFSALQIELNPRRVTATFLRHSNIVEVTVSNLGNRDETLDLYSSDPEDACAYEFETDRITVKPGHSEVVPLRIEPVTRPILGASRLYGYTVSARSVQDSYVSGTAHGQMERRAMLSTLTVITLILFAVAAASWALFRPHPVLLRSFTAAPMQVTEGDPVTLSWDAANLDTGSSYIMPGNLPVRSSVGSITVNPAVPTTYKLVARGGGHEMTKDVTIVVLPRPPAPKPKIKEFTATPKRIHLGEKVTLSWKAEGPPGTLLVLNPLGTKQDIRVWQSQEDTPDQSRTYVLAAQSPKGEVATKSVTVEVVPPTESTADILSFRAKPARVEAGKATTLSWSVDNAASIEIDNGVGGGLKPRDKFEVTPTQTTIYTLRAFDNKGNLRTKQVTVTVLPPPPPPQVPEGTETPPITTNPPPPGAR